MLMNQKSSKFTPKTEDFVFTHSENSDEIVGLWSFIYLAFAALKVQIEAFVPPTLLVTPNSQDFIFVKTENGFI